MKRLITLVALAIGLLAPAAAQATSTIYAGVADPTARYCVSGEGCRTVARVHGCGGCVNAFDVATGVLRICNTNTAYYDTYTNSNRNCLGYPFYYNAFGAVGYGKYYDVWAYMPCNQGLGRMYSPTIVTWVPQTPFSVFVGNLFIDSHCWPLSQPPQ